jgi:hypothetical protein
LVEALAAPIGPKTTRSGRFAALLSGDSGAYSALTIGDLIYDSARIDPSAVEGIDFARAADLSDIMSFARFADSIEGLDISAYAGNIAQMHGYVAERVVAGIYRAQGAEVSFPEMSNQPGFDLVINGEPFQVKCLGDAQGVLEHLKRYQGIKVLVNEELGHRFEGHDSVFPVTGLRYDEVKEATENVIDAGSDLLDFEIPLVATSIAAAKNAIACWRGHSDPISALKNITVDVPGRAMGGKMGAAATLLGLGAIGITGGWITIIAPVAGSIGGYAAAGQLTRWVKRQLFCRAEWLDLEIQLKRFIIAVVARIEEAINLGEQQRARFNTFLRGRSELADGLCCDWNRRIGDENDYRRLQASKLKAGLEHPDRLDRQSGDLRRAAVEALSIAAAAGILPANVAAEIKSLGEALDNLGRANQRHLIN